MEVDEPLDLETSEDVEGDMSNVEVDEPLDLENMTKSQLLNIAKEKGIDGINSKTTNAQLIEMIKNF